MQDDLECLNELVDKLSERMDRLADVVRELGKDIDRLQFELGAGLREVQPVIENVRKYLMDPSSEAEGLVVKFRHLERTVKTLDEAIAKGAANRQWLRRDWMAPLLAALITGGLLLLLQRLTGS